MLLAGIGLKFCPLMVTTVPTGPEEGAKELIFGKGRKLNPGIEIVP